MMASHATATARQVETSRSTSFRCKCISNDKLGDGGLMLKALANCFSPLTSATVDKANELDYSSEDLSDCI